MKTARKVITRTRKQVYNLWLKALRSGDYTQTSNQLRFNANGDSQTFSYCCLGVLCDLAVKDGGPGWFEKKGPVDWDGEPSPKIKKFLGLDNDDMNTLISLNDIEKLSFKDIADYIEHVIMPEKV